MPTARIKLTASMLEKLHDGKTVNFHLPTTVHDVEVSLDEKDFPNFDDVFDRLWNRVLRKLDKFPI